MKAIRTKTLKNLVLALALLCVIALTCGVATINRAVSADPSNKPVMTDGASVRLMTNEKKDGIRFQANLSKEEYIALKADGTFSSGIIITSTALLGANELTVETENTRTADTTDSWFIVYDDVGETEWHYSCRAVVTDMGAANYGTSLSARAYVYTESLGYIYSDYSAANNSRSMQQIANIAISGESDFDLLQALYKYVSTVTLGDGYVCEAGETIFTLPTFGDDRPEYSVVGPKGAVEVLNGNKVVLADAGEYTATFDANVVTLKAYTAATYAKILAPLTSEQFDGQIVAINDATLEYDEVMNAYEYTQTNSNDQLRILKNSYLYDKAKARESVLGDFIAIDIYFDGASVPNLFWNISDEASASQQKLNVNSVYVDTGTEIRQNYGAGSMSTGRWYTVYYTAGAMSDGAMGLSLFYGNNYNGTSYIRNIRYVDKLPGTETNLVQDKWIYEVNADLTVPVNEYGVGYEVTSPSSTSVEVDGSGAFTVTESGVYTAVQGASEITFTVYTTAEYAKILAPLTSTQFDGQIIPINSATFTYNAVMNAYAYTQTASTDQLRIVTDSELYDKAKARESVMGDYIAIDIYFVDSVPNLFWYITDEASATFQKLNVNSVYVDDGTQIKANYGSGAMSTDRWYTIYYTAGTMQTSAQGLNLFYGNNYSGTSYVRNIRYVDELPTY